MTENDSDATAPEPFLRYLQSSGGREPAAAVQRAVRDALTAGAPDGPLRAFAASVADGPTVFAAGWEQEEVSVVDLGRWLAVALRRWSETLDPAGGLSVDNARPVSAASAEPPAAPTVAAELAVLALDGSASDVAELLRMLTNERDLPGASTDDELPGKSALRAAALSAAAQAAYGVSEQSQYARLLALLASALARLQTAGSGDVIVDLPAAGESDGRSRWQTAAQTLDAYASACGLQREWLFGNWLVAVGLAASMHADDGRPMPAAIVDTAAAFRRLLAAAGADAPPGELARLLTLALDERPGAAQAGELGGLARRVVSNVV